ncbi:MAG: 4-hydroxythreonine-4-phosphate dehydrogenase PdxA [Bacteroidetes bacterium]|nr:4-hydroxythreonine-4-phosphate dehydrogenase PdxA [Bacteroidota bacterium]
MTNDKPLIGITIGDFNGVGPEIILKTLSDDRILNFCTPVVYGSIKITSQYRQILGIDDFSFNQITGPENADPKRSNIINCWKEEYQVTPGKATNEAGDCAFKALESATKDLKEGKLDAIVTAPVNKKLVQHASPVPMQSGNPSVDDSKGTNNNNFTGHTEYFTKIFEAKETLMLLVAEHIKVGVVTGHIPLIEVTKSITKEKIISKLNVLLKTLKEDFQIAKPKIAVLGLNPHAGEQGLFGEEEEKVIRPAIDVMKKEGELVFGPFSADGFFGSLQYKKFDAVLAMYHDQGLIPFKTLAFEFGVNYTAGLPVVRTSPDHGTGYDIAGKNIASEASMRQAIFLACDIVKARSMVA